jgi:hypothetical protein
MVMKKQGYREILRDRCPKIVNYALKWQKAKDAWIEHVYRNFIGIYVNKDDRNNATRIALGLKDGKTKNFNFDKTIDWDNLSHEGTIYWKRVSSWIKWFQKNFSYIENTYEISKKKGKDDFDIQIEFINNYLSWLLPSSNCTKEEKEAKYQYVDNLAEFLMKCVEGNIK